MIAGPSNSIARLQLGRSRRLASTRISLFLEVDIALAFESAVTPSDALTGSALISGFLSKPVAVTRKVSISLPASR